MVCIMLSATFFFNDTANTEIYTLSLHDALPISTGWASGSATYRASMSRSVVARVAMSRSAALSNMCSMTSYPNMSAQEKRPAGAGLFALLEWSPEVVVAYFVGWVVGYVGRLWSVTLARWFRASAGKRPRAGRFPPGTPPALYPDLT